MDNLEKWITQHREQFDGKEPPKSVWGNINRSLDENSLEGFIQENQDKFNEAEPPALLWATIEAKLPKPLATKEIKMVPMRRVWQMAAVFTLLLAVSLSFQIFYLMPDKSGNNMASMAPELVEAESFYSTVMYEKMQQIDQLQKQGITLPSDSQQAMQQLDSVYATMKKELTESQYSEKVVSSMIINLQMRIEILNQQLQILNQLNQQSHENQESNSI